MTDGVTIIYKDCGRTMVTQKEFDVMQMADDMFLIALKHAAQQIADRFCAEHADKILAAMDPQAVANLSIAEAGAKISESLQKQHGMGARIIEHTKKEVYQRGIFGGMKRVL